MMKNNVSVSNLNYHIVWCTKYRNPVIVGEIETRLKDILLTTCANYDWDLKEIETMSDHIHIFVEANPSTAPSLIAKTLKSISANHIFKEVPNLKQQRFWGSLLWSRSTYYGSIGQVSEETVRRYIQLQKRT